MGQVQWLQDFDDEIGEAFVDAGMAEWGTLTTPAGAVAPCRVFLDSEAQFFGDDQAPVAGRRTLVRLLKAEVGRPPRLSVVAIESGSFKLDEIESEDESAIRWVVARA